MNKLLLGALVSLFLVSCSTSFLKYEKADQLKKNEEFEGAVTIVKPQTEAPPEGAAESTAAEPAAAKSETPGKADKSAAKTSAKAPGKTSAKPTGKAAEKTDVKASAKTAAAPAGKPAAKTTKSAKTETAASEPAARQPDIEDSEGFNGRRPVNDPFRVGEEVVHDVHYFKVSAGELRMKVEPLPWSITASLTRLRWRFVPVPCSVPSIVLKTALRHSWITRTLCLVCSSCT
ncbi:hypothetical protein [Bdellovibrio bacteriovorus]|uniref:hypothetical protein n=1 Tax=Bdellovibrio bacteriovorus TaxID=959 RepID=UPI0035A6C8D7